jgi:hypothetical protein
MDNTDVIEAYLNNELLGDALLNFQKRLESEPELAEEIALHKQIRAFIQENEVENLKAQVKDWLKEEEEIQQIENATNTNLQKPKSNFPIGLFTKIAAGIALVSGLSWYFFTNKTTENTENQYLSELANQNPAQMQGADDRSEWAQAYTGKNYKKVLDILVKKTEKTPEESYYLGLAYLQNNQYAMAVAQFSAKNVTESVYAEKAEWLQALIYLKLNKKEAAKQILNKIKNSDSQYSDMAKKLGDI